MLRTLLLSGFSFLLTYSSFAQVNVDSLLSIFHDEAHPDSVRITALARIGGGLQMAHPDSTMIFAQMQYDFAAKRGMKKYMVGALNMLGISHQITGRCEQAISFHQQSKELAIELEMNKSAAGSLVNMGSCYSNMGQYELSNQHYTEGSELAERAGAFDFQANALVNLSLNHMYQGESEKALSGLERAESALRTAFEVMGPGMRHLQYTQAGIHLARGDAYIQQGNMNKAVEQLSLGLEVSRESGNTFKELASLSSLSTVQYELENYPEAIRFAEEGIALSERVGEQINLIASYITLGNANLQLGQESKARSIFEKALTIAQASQNLPTQITLLANLADIMLGKDSLEAARTYYEEAFELAEKIDGQAKLGMLLNGLARVNLLEKNPAEAVRLGSRALAIGRSLELPQSIQSSAEILYQGHKAMGKTGAALEMMELSVMMRDSLKREENQKAGIRQQFQYDYERQKAIDDLENEKRVAIEKEKKEQQQWLSLAIGTGLVIAIILGGIILNRLRLTRRQKGMIEEAKARAERSEKYKEQFLANMSHEIRTPMHAISGMVNILRRNEHPDSQRPYLDAMQTSSNTLLVILNDVLDMSKIEAGKLEVAQVPMSPSKVVTHVQSLLAFKAAEKGISLDVDIRSNVPELILGDPARFTQVLTNLVGNAIKFTEKGEVGISIGVEGDKLMMAVKDTGIGIPDDKLTRIFDSFSQIKGKNRQEAGGTGLGLSISRQLTALMGGKLWAESNVGKGSTFWVELPILLPDTNSAGLDLLTEPILKKMAADLTGIRILLAEDNEFNQMIATDDLTYCIEGVQLTVCDNGKKALNLMETASFDLVLMDVQMPEMDGFEATRRIRALEQAKGTRPTPIVAMTASLLQTEIENCLSAGMDDYIPKPYKMEDLISTLHKVYVQSRSEALK